jgi:hypothetical protein
LGTWSVSLRNRLRNDNSCRLHRVLSNLNRASD